MLSANRIKEQSFSFVWVDKVRKAAADLHSVRQGFMSLAWEPASYLRTALAWIQKRASVMTRKQI